MSGSFLIRHITRKAIQAALNQSRYSANGSGRGDDEYTVEQGKIIARAYFDGVKVETSHWLGGVRITVENAEKMIDERIAKMK